MAKLIALVWLLAFAVGFSVFYVPSSSHLLPEENGADDHTASLSRYPAAQTRDTPPRYWPSFSPNSSLQFRTLRQPVADDPFAPNASAPSSPRPNFDYFSMPAHNASVGTGRGLGAPRTTRSPHAKRSRKANQSYIQSEVKEEPEEPPESDSGWLHNYCLMCTNKVYDSMYAVLLLLIICSLLLTFIYSAIFYRIKKLQTMQEATVRYVPTLRSPEVIVSAEKENSKIHAGVFGGVNRRPERVRFPQGIKLPATRNRSLDDAYGRGSGCRFAEIPRLETDTNQSPNGSDTAIAASRSSLKRKCPNVRAGARTDSGVGSKPTDEANGTIVVSRRADNRYYSRRYRRGLATTLLLLVVFLVCFLPYFVLELCFALLFHHGTFDDMLNSGGAESNPIGFLNVYTRLIFYFYDLLVHIFLRITVASHAARRNTRELLE